MDGLDTKSTSQSTPNSEFNVVFQVLADNVRRLQKQLKDTQSTMQRICERANSLKKHVNEKKIHHQTKLKTLEEEKNIEGIQQKPSSISESKLIRQLQDQNKILSDTLQEYEAAINMIVTRSHQKLVQVQKEANLEKEQLRKHHQKEIEENNKLRIENNNLKAKLAEMVEIMRQSAEKTDIEVNELKVVFNILLTFF